MPVSLSAGAFCRPGRPLRRGWEEERGRERPGLPRIWVGTGPASRVAHAPCRCPDRPEKRGPDRAQIGAQFREQMQVTIALAVALSIELATMSYGRLTN
jgi:hypothetical protein